MITLTLNGTNYSIPQVGNRGWGTNVTSFFTGIANGTLQKTGGNFTLTGNVNFGPNYGLTALWLSSRSTPIATAGFMRLAVGDTFGWRNNANSGNLLLGVNGSDVLTFNGTVITAGGISSLTGDVTATGPGAAAATVVQVGGYSAANVAAGATLANAATNANTASAIVKRDGSGNFTAGSITAVGSITGSNLSGTNTGDITLGTFGSSPNNKAASLSGQVLTLQPADGVFSGLLSNTTQTIGGAKTFASAVSAPQYTSTIATGTAPLVVASTTLVANLYVARAVLADSATTNANLTGVVTSVGNATSFAASPTFTGTVTIPTPFTIGAVSMTATGTQLNYLASASGTTGTTSTNLVFSASPTLTGTAIIPVISGDASSASGTLILQSTSGAGTTDAIIFKTASQVEAARFDSAGGLRIGTTAPIGTGKEVLTVAPTITSPATGVSTALFGPTLTGDTANTNTVATVKTLMTRTITTTGPTDTGRMVNFLSGIPVFNVPTGQVLTNTNADGFAGFVVDGGASIVGGGTLAFTLWRSIALRNNTSVTGTRKIGLHFGSLSGATNNAFISDNITFTGDYFINSTNTNASSLAGVLTIANTTDSTTTATGAIITTGGLGVAKAAFIGTTLNVAGTTTHTGAVTVTGGIVGTATNNNATAGNVGEYVESVISAATNFPGATTVWGNATSISLTAGDWDVSANCELILNGATIASAATGTSQVAISINSGTTTTDQVVGNNQSTFQIPTATANRPISIPSYRVSLSGTTTVYFKILCTYTVASPQFQCRLSARRMR